MAPVELLLLLVSQAALVRPHGITMPVTSLACKILPTDTKTLSSSTYENGDKLPDVNSDIKNVDYVSSFSAPTEQEPLPKYFKPAATKRPVVTLSKSPLSQLDINRHKNFQPKETPIEIKNFISNVATTLQETSLPQINLSNKKLQNENIIINDNNSQPLMVTSHSIRNNKDINTINLKSSPPIMVQAVPYDTGKLNDRNKKPIYIDCSKKSNKIAPSYSLANSKTDSKYIPEKQISQNLIEDIHSSPETEVINITKAPLKYDEGFTASRFSDKFNIAPQSLDGIKSRNIEIPIVEKKDVYVCINEPKYIKDTLPDSDPNIKTLNEIKTKPDFALSDNKIGLGGTQTVNIDNNKVTSVPHNIISRGYQNSNIHYNFPLETLGFVQSLEKLFTPTYTPNEMPELSQLPNICTNPKTPGSSPLHNELPSPILTQPEKSISITRESIPVLSNVKPKTLENDLPLSLSDSYTNYNNAASLSLATPQSLSFVSSLPVYPINQSNIKQALNLSQLPNVYTSPEVIFSQPAQTPSVPPNIVFINTPDSSYLNSFYKTVPTIALNSEVTRCPNKIQYGLKMPPNNNDSLYSPVQGTNNMPTYEYIPNYINSNSVSAPSYISSMSSKEVPLLSQPTEYLHSPKVAIPTSNVIYSSPSEFTGLPESYTSSLSGSLNNFISTLTSNLLSAFYDMSAKSENKKVINAPISSKTVTDVHSTSYGESNFSFSMPMFMLNPPLLKCPDSLPSPKINYPSKSFEKKLSSTKRKSSGLKLAKSYISSILINVIPTKEVPDDIVIIM